MERVQGLDFPDATYFFEQTNFRQTPKRKRKRPEDLPKDLRFAHLNPRVAAYLANKEKEKAEQELLETVQHHKTLLPEIKDTVHLIRHQLDSALSNDGDSQRWLYNQFKIQAPGILIQLARVLYLFPGIRVNLPKSLEQQLLNGYKELTADVEVVIREWQIAANREEYFHKLLLLKETNKEPASEGLTPAVSTSNMSSESKAGKDDDTTSVKSDKARLRPTRPSSRQSVLADIAENEGEPQQSPPPRGSSSRIHGETPTAVAPSRREGSLMSGGAGYGTPGPHSRPKTRLEKFRTGMFLEQGLGNRSSSSSRRSRSRLNLDEMSLVESVSESSKLMDKSGFYTVIQFQLSSKACEDKGWIVHQAPTADKERETLYEWATQRLQVSIKQRKDQENADKEIGHDKPLVLRYYGDSRRDILQQHNLHPQRPLVRSALQLQGKLSRMELPYTDQSDDGKKLFMTAVADGSTIVYYPSGRPAIVTSSSGVERTGYYTFVYDDTLDQGMLASFTPSGRGCCYHDNGVIRLLALENGGTVADKNGAVTKRFVYPNNGARLPTTIVLQLNSMLTFRLVSQQQVHIYFNYRKETAKISVAGVAGVASVQKENKKQVQEYLVTGLSFTSQAAKDHIKEEKTIQVEVEPKKKQKGKKGKVTNAEPKSNRTESKVELNLPPERTENDPEADAMLYKLQRKIKNTVEDWLEHYRLAVGIASPHLRSVSGFPGRRQRQTGSAKSSPGGCRVIIESLATSIPAPSVEPRVPSAPPGRSLEERMERPSAPDSLRPKSVPPGEPNAEASVTFNEYHPNTDDDYSNSHTYTSSKGRAQTAGPYMRKKSTGAAQRSRSAPHRMVPPATSIEVSTLPYGACPVALRGAILGEDQNTCKCSRHKIPYVCDLEYEEFVQRYIPDKQLLIIAVVSSLYPESSPAMEMVERMHADRNRNRTRPCLQARTDAFRIVKYDIATAAEESNHSQPLLLRRHNIIAGMFLMYQGGQLVFCDHIFNGYGNARKDFQKQLMLTRRSAGLGYHLPRDFRFSPQRGRHGPRAAWGGEIGGAGVDRYASAGLSADAPANKGSLQSLSSTDSGGDVPLDYHLSHQFDSAARYISMSLSGGYKIRPMTTAGAINNHSPSSASLFGATDGEWRVPRLSKYSPSFHQYSTPTSRLNKSDTLPTICSASSLLAAPN